MGHDNFHPGPRRAFYYKINSWLRPPLLRQRPISHQNDLPLFHIGHRPRVPRVERIQAVRVHLLHMLRAVDRPCAHGHHTTCLRGKHHGHRVHEVLRAVGHQRRGGPHGTGQHHRFGGLQHGLQEKRGFFQGVGAMGDHHPLHLFIRQPVRHTAQQSRPHTKFHVLAVQLRDLLRLNGQPAKTGHRRQQVLDAHLCSGVANVVARGGSRARNRPARAQKNDLFSCFHCCNAPTWLVCFEKLVKNTVTGYPDSYAVLQ